jgi:acetate kinase
MDPILVVNAGSSSVKFQVFAIEGSSDPRAAFALEYFIYRIGFHAGMLAAALDGLDAFVFTAGIGENWRRCAHGIAEKLAWPERRSIPVRTPRTRC